MPVSLPAKLLTTNRVEGGQRARTSASFTYIGTR
jgi:hypothetical protein